MVDKDLTNIELLKQFFPKVVVLLCKFHVLKWFKTLVNNMVSGKDQKQKVHDILEEMVYAFNEHALHDAYEKLKQEPNIGELVNNLDDNWMNCQETWVKYHRSHSWNKYK